MRWIASVFVLGSTIAHADPAASAKAIEQAEAFVSVGDFPNAAAKYREAYAADPRAELICNVGVAYVKAHDIVRAHLYLSRCLERGTAFDEKFLDSVRSTMAATEAQLRAGEFTPIDIVVSPAGATIAIGDLASDETLVGSRVVWLPFGKHAISAHLEGYKDATVEVVAATHTTTAASIALERVGAVVTPPPRPHREVTTTGSKMPAIIASAGTAGAIVFAGLAFHYAHARADRAQFAIDSTVYASDRNAIDGWNRMMAISGALAVAGAGITGFLWYRAFHTETRVEVDAAIDHAALMFSRGW